MPRILRPTTLISTLLLALLFLAAVCPAPTSAALPGGVTHRLKQIDQHMTKVEAYLAEGRANHNELERAQEALKEIKRQYASSAGASEVVAAQQRIEKGAADIAKLEGDKAAAKAEKEEAEKAADLNAEQWADRLGQYKADTKEGSKGNFGCPMSDPDQIVALAPNYKEAKAVYEEFLATGIDKESHWKLRQADWDIKVSIENYEGSINRLYDEAYEEVKRVGEFLAGQKRDNKLIWYPTDLFNRLKKQVEGVNKLFPSDDPKLKTLNTAMEQAETDQAAIEKMALSKRKMKPDVFKGKEAASVKSVAKSVVTKAHPTAKILKVHITSSDWQTESATEWTDTTKTAVQHRTTRGVNVQVAAKQGTDCFLYTVWVHREKIGGSTGSLTGHIMFTDKFLEANVPK